MIRRGLAIAAVVALAACGGDDGGEAAPLVALDGTPRHAQVSGRLTDIADDFSTITVDDEVLEVADEIVSFAALDASLHPLAQWERQYVQVGLVEDEVVWVGGLGAVVDLPGEPEVVYFTDVLVEVSGTNAVFRSGTVLTLGADAVVPETLPAAIVVTLDVASDLVVAVEPG